MSVPLLLNAGAGRRTATRALEALAIHSGLEVHGVNGADDAHVKIVELAERSPRVIVAGGDGTVHHALRALAGTETELGIVPLGTGNDFAAALGIPPSPEAALQRAMLSEPVAVDIAWADGVPFCTMAGVGIVADVLTYLEGFTRKYRGNWVYPWAVLRTVLRYRPLDLTIESAEGSFEGPAMIALAANTPRFGGGMRVAPDASMHDGLLDVVVLRRTSRVGLVRLLPRVYRGTHISDRRCLIFRASSMRLSSSPGAVVYADGEALPVDTASAVHVRAEAGGLQVAI